MSACKKSQVILCLCVHYQIRYSCNSHELHKISKADKKLRYTTEYVKYLLCYIELQEIFYFNNIKSVVKWYVTNSFLFQF